MGSLRLSEPSPPSRDLPRAVLVGLSLVILSYLLVNLAFFSVLCYDEILSAEALGLVRCHSLTGGQG